MAITEKKEWLISFSDSIGSTPAQVNRETGEIFLNSDTWNQLPKPYQAFILEHEKGHFNLQTTNELEADHYAFKQIAGTFPESLKNTVRCLSGVLPYTSPMHRLRLQNIYRLALCYDYEKEPTAERLQAIRAVEADILQDFSNNTEFMDYIYAQKSTMPKYEFPGYAPGAFDSHVGRYFRDFPAKQTGQPVPWPISGTPIAGNNPGGGNVVASTPSNTAVTVPESVAVDSIPDFGSVTVTLDLKTVVICFLVLIIVSILNKL